MKVRFAITVAALALPAFAQNVPATKPKLQNSAPTGKPAQEVHIEAPHLSITNDVDTNIFLIPRSASATNLPIFTYSGLLPDARRSTNLSKTFSLRRPANPKEDGANLIHNNTRTEAAKPFKLLSIDF